MDKNTVVFPGGTMSSDKDCSIGFLKAEKSGIGYKTSGLMCWSDINVSWKTPAGWKINKVNENNNKKSNFCTTKICTEYNETNDSKANKHNQLSRNTCTIKEELNVFKSF